LNYSFEYNPYKKCIYILENKKQNKIKMSLNPFSTAPELDIEKIKKMIFLIENLNETNAIDSCNQMKELCIAITWKETNFDLELVLYLEKSINHNFESVKLKLDTYKVTLKFKLERLVLYLNALTKDKGALKAVANLIQDFDKYNFIETCSLIGNLTKNISWKEDNPEYIRNKHGFRSRWVKKPNKLNSDGARINFEILSHLNCLHIQEDWIQTFLMENFDYVKLSFNCLKKKIHFILNDCLFATTCSEQDEQCLSGLIRFLAFVHIKECIEKLKAILNKLNEESVNLNLNDKIHRFYLGYLLVNIGEITSEMIQCIKPEIFEGKPDEADSQIEIMLKNLKQCRKLIKAKPENILEGYDVIEFIKSTICSNHNALINILDEFELNVIEFIKISFLNSANIYDKFKLFNDLNKQEVGDTIKSLEEIKKYVKKSKIERLLDRMKCDNKLDNISDFDDFKKRIIEDYNNKEMSNNLAENEDSELKLKLKCLNRLLLKFLNKFECSEIKMVKLDNLNFFINNNLLLNQANLKVKKSNLKQLKKESKKLLDLWNCFGSSLLDYLKRIEIDTTLITVEDLLNAFLKIAKVSDDEHQEAESEEIKHKNENVKLEYVKPDGLDAKLKGLNVWNILSELRDFHKIRNDQTKTKKFILNICIIINEALFYEKIEINSEKSFENFNAASSAIECKNYSLKMSFAIIGQYIKEIFREANLSNNVMKFYKYDTLFDYSNLLTVIQRNKIMHIENEANQVNTSNNLENTRDYFSCWIESIKSILFLILNDYDKSWSILYDHFIDKDIGDYFKSLDQNVQNIWRTYFVMLCYNRLTAYNETISLFEDVSVQHNMNCSLGMLLSRIYNVYFTALEMTANYEKIKDCYEAKIEILAEDNAWNRELKVISKISYDYTLLALANPENINQDMTIIEDRLLNCFHCIEKGDYEKPYEILIDTNLNLTQLSNVIITHMLLGKCLKFKSRLKESLDELNKALALLKNKKSVLIRIFGGMVRFLEADLLLEISSIHMNIFESLVADAYDVDGMIELKQCLDNAYEHANLARLISTNSDLAADLLNYGTSCANLELVHAWRWRLKIRETKCLNYINDINKSVLSALNKLKVNNKGFDLKIAQQLFSLCMINELVGEINWVLRCFEDLIKNNSVGKISFINSISLNDTKALSYALILLLETNDLRIYSEFCDYVCEDSFNSESLKHLENFEIFFVKYQNRLKCLNEKFELNLLLAYINAYKCKIMYSLWEECGKSEIAHLHNCIKFSLIAANLSHKANLKYLTRAKFNALPTFIYLKFKSLIRVNEIEEEINENFLNKCNIILEEFPIHEQIFDNINQIIDYLLIIEKLYTIERYMKMYETEIFKLIEKICRRMESMSDN
jgi:hypothetical protein